MSQIKPKVCEKKIKAAEQKLIKILNKIEILRVPNSLITQLDVPANSKTVFHIYWNIKHFVFLTAVFVLICGVVWCTFKEIISRDCLLGLPSSSKTLFRPPEDCSMCKAVDGVTRLTNTSADEFEQFAYNAAPVIITDATHDWKAVKEFSFQFFADFYGHGKMGKQINDCFYFPYKSGLNSLQEVFNMEEDRANLSGKPWYVGWSTCFDEETRKLREYYTRPYFLPKTAESDMVDWIFMGGPGQGAHMHVDSVKHMSWQAQMRGHKQWQLAPPPECLYQCRWITFTVAPGEILVVDTNRWYHMTNVLPGDISITIGAEYD